MSILVITPHDDPSSRESGRWADALVKRHQGQLVGLTNRSRSATDKALAQHQHVFYFGHGELNHFVVPPGLIRKRVELAEESTLRGTADRVVVAVSCWTGDGLGRKVVDPGTTTPVVAYVGWLDDVGWPDEWPDPIGDAIVEALDAFCTGGDVAQLVQDLRDRFDDAHAEYRQNGGAHGMSSDRVFLAKASALYWRARLAQYGDASTTL